MSLAVEEGTVMIAVGLDGSDMVIGAANNYDADNLSEFLFACRDSGNTVYDVFSYATGEETPTSPGIYKMHGTFRSQWNDDGPVCSVTGVKYECVWSPG